MVKFKRYIPKSCYTKPKYTLGRECTVKGTTLKEIYDIA